MENRFGECRSRQLGEYSGVGWASAEADSHLLPKNEIENSHTGFLRAALQKTIPQHETALLGTPGNPYKPASGQTCLRKHNIFFLSPTCSCCTYGKKIRSRWWSGSLFHIDMLQIFGFHLWKIPLPPPPLNTHSRIHNESPQTEMLWALTTKGSERRPAVQIGAMGVHRR